MKKLGFIFVMTFFLIAFICPLKVQAGEIYTYTDKDGNTVITNTPVPEKYEKKAKKIDSYKRDSPEEIQRYQAEQKAREQSREAETRQKRQINEAQQAAQKQNNRQQAQQREAKKKEPSCYLTKESCTVSGGIVSGGTVSGGMLIGGTVSGGSEHCHATEVCTDEYGHETRKRVKTR